MQSLVDGASQVDPAASDIGDLDSIEQFDDDAAWGKIEKGRRKAMLGLSRDRLAKDVKSSLGGFAKVSSTKSPFAKKS